MDTRLKDDLYRADALTRHMFVSAEAADSDGSSWLDRHRRANGGELCKCGLMYRNRRHFKIRRRAPAR